MNMHLLPGVSGSYMPPSTSSFTNERGFIIHGPVVYLITGFKPNRKYKKTSGNHDLDSGPEHTFPAEVEVVVIPQSLYEKFGHFEGIDWVNNPPIALPGATAQSGPTNVPTGPANAPTGPTNVPDAPQN